MTIRGCIAAATVLAAVACAPTDEEDPVATTPGPASDSPVAATIARAEEVEDLPTAHELTRELVETLIDRLDVDRRETELGPVGISPCDESADTPRLVSYSRSVSFPPEATDDVLTAVRDELEAAGVDGLDPWDETEGFPALVGVFDDRRWQVGFSVNREAGVASVGVNSPCLPGELDDEDELLEL